ncbi:hypothetical protein ACIPY6_03040 [Streptomyces sp. NPDC090054]|uniref:hypothetical protein n=1 Tax=Streptomyces sp. NPDC090054 TaxID=3365933 RepID=UPI0037F1467E
MTQPIGPIGWANQQQAEREQQSLCCACGSPNVVYRNYREQPFCDHCANCACGRRVCEIPPPPRPRRPVDTSGCAARRASITHLLNRAGRGALAITEAELLRVQVEAELRVADLRAEQAEASTACAALAAAARPILEAATAQFRQAQQALQAAGYLDEHGQPVQQDGNTEPYDRCDCPPTQAGLTLCPRCPGNAPKEPTP